MIISIIQIGFFFLLLLMLIYEDLGEMENRSCQCYNIAGWNDT